MYINKLQEFKLIKELIPIVTCFQTNNDTLVVTTNASLLFTLKCFKKHINFQYALLSCISGVDLFGYKYRFSVVYDLLSLTHNSRIRIKVLVDHVNILSSCVKLFINANWWEREIWDLYGIYFKNHPDLRRILTDYGFEGYPLRKDFPLSGYVEVRYDENKNRVVLEFIELTQEYRTFKFDIPLIK